MTDSDTNNPWDKETRWNQPDANTPDVPAPATPDIPVYGTPAESAPTPPSPPAPPIPQATPPAMQPAVSPPAMPPPATTPPVMTPPVMAPTTPPPAMPPPAMPTITPPVAATPPPVVDAPILSGTYGESAPVAPVVDAGGGGSRFAWIAAVVGALVLLVGGGFFALSALGSEGGADTPDEAIDEMLAAVGNEDFLTLGELLEPGERRTIVEPLVTDILPELIRLGVLSDDADPSSVEGVEIDFNEVTYRVDQPPGQSDLAHVYFTGGSATTSADGDLFPFGDAIRDRFGDEIEDSPEETETVEESDTPIVLVERNGKWYVSMWYTIGEAARIEAGERLPTVDEQPVPAGSGSPEEAVEAMIQEMVDFDLEGIITRLDPEEASALYRYSPLFLEEGQSVFDDAEQTLRDEGVRWAISDFEYDVDSSGDDAIVTIRSFTATVSAPDVEVSVRYSPTTISLEVEAVVDGERFDITATMTPSKWTVSGVAAGETFDGEVVIDTNAESVRATGTLGSDTFTGSIELDPDGACSNYRVQAPDVDEQGCLEELIDEAGGDALVQSQISDLFEEFPDEFAGLPIATRKTDGDWYVSPTGTAMHGVTAGLQSLDDEDVANWLDEIEAEGSAVGVDSIFDAIDQLESETTTDTVVAAPDDPPEFVDDEPLPFEEASFAITPDADVVTTYSDDLPAGNASHVYLLELEAGQTVGVLTNTAGVSGAMGDSVLAIETPDGVYSAGNDDFVGLDSGVQFTTDSTGTWRVVVTDLGQVGGAYELVVEVASPGNVPTVASSAFPDIGEDPEVAGPAVVGDITEAAYTEGEAFILDGDLEPGIFDVLLLDLPADQDFTVTVVGTALDPVVYVLEGFEGALIVSNDDADLDSGLPQSTDSAATFVSVGDGLTAFEIYSYEDSGTGAYTITVTPVLG